MRERGTKEGAAPDGRPFIGLSAHTGRFIMSPASPLSGRVAEWIYFIINIYLSVLFMSLSTEIVPTESRGVEPSPEKSGSRS